ncbi:uncharacterized protein [Hetaerina americana]|uniref:uncharacterized protein n=1 Tax=Hetaerina americana TaxID=62018 RepID=UPI003A7F4098
MATVLRREDCEAAVRNFIKSSDFVLEDYKFKPLSDKTMGFMGRHLKLTASVRFGGVVQQLRLFAKLIPTGGSHRSFVVDLDFFKKEMIAYDTLVPRLISCLPQGMALPVPMCFFTRGIASGPGTIPIPGSADEELIILEDVTQRGYRILENFPPMDVPHCRAALRALARLHASSILLEESCRAAQPANFDPRRDLFAGVKESFLLNQKEGHTGYAWAKRCAESLTTASFTMWPELFRGVSRDSVMEGMMRGWTRVFEAAQPSDEFPNVLCHGDMWTNNIMFSEEKGELDALLVDLQLVRYAPPAFDILLFLHVCTKRAFRERHLEELLKFYHEALGECLPAGFLERFLPFGKLLEMCDCQRDAARVICTGYLPIILGENDEVIGAEKESSSEPLNLDETMMKDRGDRIVSNCIRSENYKEWITEAFQDCLFALNLCRQYKRS